MTNAQLQTAFRKHANLWSKGSKVQVFRDGEWKNLIPFCEITLAQECADKATKQYGASNVRIVNAN